MTSSTLGDQLCPSPLSLKDITYAPPRSYSYDSSPISSNSVISGFGHDLNRDFAVSVRLEELLGFEIEPEELQESVTAANHHFGTQPTIRQLSYFINDQSKFAPVRLTSHHPSSPLPHSRIMTESSPTPSPKSEVSVNKLDKTISASPLLPTEFSVPRLRLISRPEDHGHSFRDLDGEGHRELDAESMLCVLLPHSTPAQCITASYKISPSRDVTRDQEDRQPAMKLQNLQASTFALAHRKTRKAVTSSKMHHCRSRSKCLSLDSIDTSSRALLSRQLAKSVQEVDKGIEQDVQARDDSGVTIHAANAVEVLSHPLPEGWWLEECLHSGVREADFLLPDSLSNIIEALWRCHDPQQTHDSIAYGNQIAHTAQSTVLFASFQGRRVVAKVLCLGEDLRNMPHAVAEIACYVWLANWRGSPKLFHYTATNEEVVMMLQACDCNMRQWLESQRHSSTHSQSQCCAMIRKFIDMASLVKELHERHISHGDIKLDNFLLHDGEILLSDFGESSMFFNSDSDVILEARGTEAYQCPELKLGCRTSGCSADVWALGCLLYELVTNMVLFPGQSSCLRTCQAESKSWMTVEEELNILIATGGNHTLAKQIQELLLKIFVDQRRRISVQGIIEDCIDLLNLNVLSFV
ncbi:hypothetical protein CEUSTIGMA_g11279.t1 [Chlamydomonas eustigma]|uniref:Protein kinase domain-containing protein n=1 Tax=Chlamydomonas eustigma TaxID=1157962 RepID=A0A250XLA2_9CHLO|nr:hypothetical protein CEUSTIGMA_g11279.t1 [Chlamydomonas eustigma]|eukprot:GAX83854.1 hypothetical protein CEUSTIGMA_g11279.t1 [Chlamydomonas eustigma]